MQFTDPRRGAGEAEVAQMAIFEFGKESKTAVFEAGINRRQSDIRAGDEAAIAQGARTAQGGAIRYPEDSAVRVGYVV